MDLNDTESCREIAYEQQQKKQQQKYGIHKRNEVVPSSETSIGDDNELTTTITIEHKQQTVSVDGPSNGTLQKQSSIEKQFKHFSDAQESDDGSCISHLRYESETDDSESHLIIHSETERTDTETASIRPTTTIKENGGTAPMKQLANKHKSSDTIGEQYESDDSNFSDDGEQFKGFSMIEVNLSKASSVFYKKFKTNPAPDPVSIRTPPKIEGLLSSTMNDRVKTPPVAVPALVLSPALKTPGDKPAHVITTDPRYRNPFKFGWKRELVFRANVDNKQKLENKGEVYYHSPSGKKLRSKGEIQGELRDLKDQNLDIGDFTFAKERIGMPPDIEIVRKAKIQTPSQRKQPVLEPVPDVLGKRVPKPKMPKGASPPPSSTLNKSRTSFHGSNKRLTETEIIEVIQPKVQKSNSGREACTINCVRAMGIIPQLQCRKCQFMYHHECASKDGSRHISNFICEHCVREKNEAAQSAQATQAAATKDANQNARNGNTNYSTDKQKDRANKKATVTAATPIKLNPNSLLKTRPVFDDTLKRNDTIASLTINKSQPDSTSAPQSIAIVAGRKYIMVPKANATAPDSANGISAAKSSSDAGVVVSSTKSSASISNANQISPSSHSKNNTYANASPTVQSLFASQFFGNVSAGYNVLFNIFQYLKVQELLRASSVCRMWSHVANNNILWETVRMKNSQANDWSGLMTALRRHGTKHLDLRKILIPSTLDWNDFITHICLVPDLKSLHLCRCPAEVVTALLETNTHLTSLNALSIQGDSVALPIECNLTGLTELRLKSNSPISIENLQSLKILTNLRHLSLTSVKLADVNQLEPLTLLTSLESLEFGDCNTLTSPFAKNILPKLRKLERLRLEKGQERCCTFEIIETIEKLPKLAQLELVNFDIRSGFDTRLAQCKRLKRILLIPTYISQSAATNNVIMSCIAQLGNTLQAITWVVTQELIRVTDLYTNECHSDGQPRKPSEDKIPIIKPVPMMTDSPKLNSSSESNTQLVEILPLSKVEEIIRTNIPKLKLKIVKVPFSTTVSVTINGTQ